MLRDLFLATLPVVLLDLGYNENHYVVNCDLLLCSLIFATYAYATCSLVFIYVNKVIVLMVGK